MTDTSAMTVALIAAGSASAVALISYLGGRASTTRTLKKDVALKIAEYRLSWINEINDEIATFISSSLRIRRYILRKEEDKLSDTLQQMHKSAFKVRLLMNRQDEHYDNIVEMLRSIAKDSYTIAYSTIVEEVLELAAKVYADQTKLVELANSIAKTEWRKTKDNLRKDAVPISSLASAADPGHPTTTFQQLKLPIVRFNTWFNSWLPACLRDPP